MPRVLPEGAHVTFTRTRYDINGRASPERRDAVVVLDEGLRTRIQLPGESFTRQVPRHTLTEGWGSVKRNPSARAPKGSPVPGHPGWRGFVEYSPGRFLEYRKATSPRKGLVVKSGRVEGAGRLHFTAGKYGESRGWGDEGFVGLGRFDSREAAFAACDRGGKQNPYPIWGEGGYGKSPKKKNPSPDRTIGVEGRWKYHPDITSAKLWTTTIRGRGVALVGDMDERGVVHEWQVFLGKPSDGSDIRKYVLVGASASYPGAQKIARKRA